MLHCFSVDVEGFAEGLAESIPIPREMVGSAAERKEIEVNTDDILEWLDTVGVRGTFFILGRIAESLPRMVRRIADSGHEIGSHSQDHLRLYDLHSARAREALVRSKRVLEDASGLPVFGFRAPDFSITGRNLELLDVLVEAGYRYDSSIYPIAMHDVYGVPLARREIHRLENGLVEMPPATCRIAGHVIPMLGGGYFRLSPLWLSAALVQNSEHAGQPVMSYIHPYEIGPSHPVIGGLSWKQRLRHYVNIGRSKQRYTELFRRFRFGRAIDVLEAAGFGADRVESRAMGLDRP